MSLVPCRACGHQVDTSALACPGCGATDPASRISRQQRNAISFAIQLVFWLAVLSACGWYIWTTVVPMAKQYITKQPTEQVQSPRP